jgi:hypothetical protein
MKFLTGLKRARSNIAFLLGLGMAVGIVYTLESADPSLSRIKPTSPIKISGLGVVAEPLSELPAADMKAARIAWKYFENNTQEATGLVNSVKNYPSTTMWDQASYLMALISVERLRIIDGAEFDRRVEALLTSLARLPLFDGKLPNKAYDTKTLVMTDYQNNKSERGIGWSALDVARIIVPLNLIVWHYPEHSARVKSVLKAWKFEAMLQDGVFVGTRIGKTGKTEIVQEGRLGYEEYAARAMALMGFDTVRAQRVDDYLRFETVGGQKIAIDTRSYKQFNAHNYVVSEPYILMALEMGLDTEARELAYRVYKAQEQRYRTTGIETAVSEDNVDQPPYFVYNTVFSDGKAWNALGEDGNDASHLRSLSTKAVYGWHSLFRTSYTRQLVDGLAKFHDPEEGWYSGRYEADGKPNTAITANSNGIVLESIYFKRFGSFASFR